MKDVALIDSFNPDVDYSLWFKTSKGEPRGYIEFDRLKELWFNTGTICNLSCPDCFEGSGPGVHRLGMITFQEAKPLIDEAVELGVQQFSFTGGEPFIIPEMVKILTYALEFAPCLVLTNGTKPIRKRFEQLKPLLEKKHKLSFRISLDFPDAERHDAIRGKGMFDLAIQTLQDLHSFGFPISVARRRTDKEITFLADQEYSKMLEEKGLPKETLIISFPDLQRKGAPEITTTCMTKYHTKHTRANFMCAFSRMVVKKDGKMRVYACTLVDDDPKYDFGGSIRESMKVRTMLQHERCYTCFAGGMSCSELNKRNENSELDKCKLY